MSLIDDDPLPADAYDAACRVREECYARIVALLARRDELPAWLVEALEAIVEEVL